MPDPEIVRKVTEALEDKSQASYGRAHVCDCNDLHFELEDVLAVAEPLIREQVAQEIEASRATNTFRTTVLERAAGIARGGQ